MPEKEKQMISLKSNPFKGNPTSIQEGRKLFEKKCSQCHGPDAGGGPEAPDLTDKIMIYGVSDRDLFESAYSGRPNGMPTWKDELGPEKIWKVLAYIDSLKK